MAKLFVVLSVVLAVSVAYAYDPEAEEKKRGALAVKNCVQSINRIFIEVARKYEQSVKSIEDDQKKKEAFEYYDAAAQVFNALNAEVREAKEPIRISFILKTFGGNAIMCSDDVALQVYDAFFKAYDGLDKLAKSAGQSQNL